MKISKCCSILCENADKIDWKSIFLSQKPLILKQLVCNSEARKKWHDLNYLKSKVIEYGAECSVPVEIGGHYMSKQMQCPHVNFIEFIDYLIQLQQQVKNEDLFANSSSCNNKSIINLDNGTNESLSSKHPHHNHNTYDQSKHLYLAQHDLSEIPPLIDDISIPEMATTTGKGQYYGTKLWLGSSLGTMSPCHYDPYHNILCQIVGQKRILLFPYDQEKYLYPYYNTAQKNTSQVNFEDYHLAESDIVSNNVPMCGINNTTVQTDNNNYNNNIKKGINDRDSLQSRFPMTEHLNGCIAELQPGDGLLIPLRYWHHCQSYDLSCSVSFWWL